MKEELEIDQDDDTCMNASMDSCNGLSRYAFMGKSTAGLRYINIDR